MHIPKCVQTCVCTYLCVCMCVCGLMLLCVHQVCTCLCVLMCKHVCVGLCGCACIECVRARVCSRASMCLCMHMCVCECVHKCVYVAGRTRESGGFLGCLSPSLFTAGAGLWEASLWGGAPCSVPGAAGGSRVGAPREGAREAWQARGQRGFWKAHRPLQGSAVQCDSGPPTADSAPWCRLPPARGPRPLELESPGRAGGPGR